MLIRFAVENFKSFKDRQTISMAASKATRMYEHVINVSNKRLLKGAFIFGANAGGKSNLIKAIDFARKYILFGSDCLDFSKNHFRLSAESFSQPGSFQFDIMINETAYSYGFAFSYITKDIVAEWLYDIDKDKCIFERNFDEEQNKITLYTDYKLNQSDSRRFQVYKEDYEEPENLTARKRLFLSDMASKSVKDSVFFKLFFDVFQWFTKLIVIFPESKFEGLTSLIKENSLKSIFEEYLKYFDTGVESIDQKEIDFDTIFKNIPNEIVHSIRADISNNLTQNDSISLNIAGTLYTLRQDNEGNITSDVMLLNHGNQSDLFECKDESDGTQRLFDLIPLILSSMNDTVIIIDEIDRSLHSCLTKKFIETFYSASDGTHSQMIATTHESAVMDLSFVRQDEIWFIEREKNHQSIIYSLNKFNERFDKKIEKDYLLGRYGAIPCFKQNLE